MGCDPSVCGSAAAATWAQLGAAAVMRAMGRGGAALQEATVAKSNTQTGNTDLAGEGVEQTGRCTS